MENLIKLAAWALVASGKAGAMRAARARIAIALVCTAFAVLLVLAAVGCAAAALWIFTERSMGPVSAPLVVAASLTAVAAALSATTWLVIRHGRRKAGTTPQLLMAEATRLFNEHKGAVLLAAVIAGMAAANSGRKA